MNPTPLPKQTLAWTGAIALILGGFLWLSGSTLVALVKSREPLRLIGVILMAQVAHLNTDGGQRAAHIIRDSQSSQAMTQVQLKQQGKNYAIPLPPGTIRMSCDRLLRANPNALLPDTTGLKLPESCRQGAVYPKALNAFITISAPRAFHDDYLMSTLPAAGWKFKDQLGSVLLFEQNQMQLQVNVGSHLTTQISDFYLDLEPLS